MPAQTKTLHIGEFWMLIPLKSWFILMMMILLPTSAIYYRALEKLPLPSSDDQRVRTVLAERWAQKVALQVRRLPGRPVVAVARVVNDDEGILTAQLKKWIARRNVLMRNDQWYSGLGYAAGVTGEPKSTDEACQVLASAKVDFIVAAEIANWTTYPEFEATLMGHVEIRDGKSGENILKYQLSLPEMIEVVQSTPAVTSEPAEKLVARMSTEEGTRQEMSRQPAWPPSRAEQSVLRAAYSPSSLSSASTSSLNTGLSLWLALMGGCPVLWSKPLKRVLRHKSNRLNFCLLLSWITATALLAGILWLRLLSPGAAALAGAFSITFSAVYFGYCCYCLEKIQ
jgi:hypothetical protein